MIDMIYIDVLKIKKSLDEYEYKYEYKYKKTKETDFIANKLLHSLLSIHSLLFILQWLILLFITLHIQMMVRFIYTNIFDIQINDIFSDCDR